MVIALDTENEKLRVALEVFQAIERREVVNAILYLASGGCAWALLPKEFPHRSTVQRYFYAWRDSGVLLRINHHLVAAARDLEGREASLSLAASRLRRRWLRRRQAQGSAQRNRLVDDPGRQADRQGQRLRTVAPPDWP